MSEKLKIKRSIITVLHDGSRYYYSSELNLEESQLNTPTQHNNTITNNKEDAFATVSFVSLFGILFDRFPVWEHRSCGFLFSRGQGFSLQRHH